MAKRINLRTTTQGFRRGVFTDCLKNKCVIEETRTVDDLQIWLGTEHQMDGNRMLLDQEQVKALLPMLQKFAETGELR